MRKRLAVLLVGSAALAAAVVTGCGGGGNDNTTNVSAGASGAGASEGAQDLTIKMTDFGFTPKNVTAKAGTVKITSPNEGNVEHELVLLKTNQDPSSLPLKGDEVNEEGLEAKGVESPGEIEEVGPGQTKSGTFKLTPGRYVMICNVAGHYQAGMWGTLNVQ